jgi:hypothetical protein
MTVGLNSVVSADEQAMSSIAGCVALADAQPHFSNLQREATP